MRFLRHNVVIVKTEKFGIACFGSCIWWYSLCFRDAIEFLSSEGHIYSTIDDEHYKPTDSWDVTVSHLHRDPISCLCQIPCSHLMLCSRSEFTLRRLSSVFFFCCSSWPFVKLFSFFDNLEQFLKVWLHQQYTDRSSSCILHATLNINFAQMQLLSACFCLYCWESWRVLLWRLLTVSCRFHFSHSTHRGTVPVRYSRWRH